MPGALILLLLLSLGADDYIASVEAWRAERLESLRKPDGWLSLVGLVWVEPGTWTFGSEGDLVLPEPAPALWGRLTLSGEEAVVEIDGSRTVVDLTEREGTTVFSSGTQSWYFIRREGRVAMRVKDSASPVRLSFAGLEHYPVDPAWRLVGRFEARERPISVPNILGSPTVETSPGVVVVSVGGADQRLDLLEDDFLVFADATNGETTYPAGRFLYCQPLEDGRMVVDFNRAYNPPCAFTPYATCPLPPEANVLSVPVEAGEKYSGEH